MYIYVVSDIHLEHIDKVDVSMFIGSKLYNNSILILPGDICSIYLYDKLKTFLKCVSSIFKHIIYVPGNGEYYKPKDFQSITFSKLNQNLDNLSNHIDNLTILNKSSMIINDILISGCTLWSHINCELPPFFKISGFNSQIYNRKNKNDINFIKEQIEYAKNNNLRHIVVTHYPPSKQCIKNYRKHDKYMSMYYNNLDSLFSNELVWIYGHTHTSINKCIEKTKLVSNQYGKKKHLDENFNNSFNIFI